METHTTKYVCPMHSEVTSDAPGRCTKCGMALVPADAPSAEHAVHHEDRGLGFLTWRSYLPLVAAIGMIVLGAGAASFSDYRVGSLSAADIITRFMTGFFLVFSGFKLMDLKGFADGYMTYDLLASRVRAYGYIYPFIELAFGLVMLAGFHPDWLLWTEAGVMVFSGLGVAIKLARREPFMCACLGTFLKVPLTYVTLVEDFGMAVLALALIVLL